MNSRGQTGGRVDLSELISPTPDTQGHRGTGGDAEVTAIPFGDLFLSIRNGMNIKQDKSGDGLPITRIETIWAGKIDPSRVGYAGLKSEGCRQWMLQSGDILFSHINSAELVGKCAVYRGTPDLLVHGMNLLCLRPNPSRLDSNFAQWMIRSSSFRGKLSNFVNKAVNQASVSIGNLSTIPVSVPPLEEQRRIAAILDKADALRQKRRLALQKLDSLTQSIFLDMFGDPRASSGNWKKTKLDFVCELITDGEHQTPRRTVKGIKLLSARNVQNGYLDLDDVDYVDETEYVRITARCKPRRDDLLLSCSGTIGRASSIRTDEPFALVRSAALIRSNQDIVRSDFLESWLLLPALNSLMKMRANSSGQANLFQNQIRDLPIIVPPLDVQDRFISRAHQVRQIRGRMQLAMDHGGASFESLQHRAFRGEL